MTMRTLIAATAVATGAPAVAKVITVTEVRRWLRSRSG